MLVDNVFSIAMPCQSTDDGGKGRFDSASFKLLLSSRLARSTHAGDVSAVNLGALEACSRWFVPGNILTPRVRVG